MMMKEDQTLWIKYPNDIEKLRDIIDTSEKRIVLGWEGITNPPAGSRGIVIVRFPEELEDIPNLIVVYNFKSYKYTRNVKEKFALMDINKVEDITNRINEHLSSEYEVENIRELLETI